MMRSRVPIVRKATPSEAPQTRAAVSAIVWSTIGRSAGERLMMRSTSLVAFSRSRLSARRFSRSRTRGVYVLRGRAGGRALGF